MNTISKQAFVEYIESERMEWERNEGLRKLGVNIRDTFSDYPINLSKAVFRIFWTETQIDFLEWWLYDTPNGISENPEKDYLHDEHGQPIDIRTPETLFDYIVSIEGVQK